MFYKTFKRSCTDWKSFGSARKITVETVFDVPAVVTREPVIVPQIAALPQCSPLGFGQTQLF